MEGECYVALIGDVVQSRQQGDTEAMRQDLARCARWANEAVRADLAAHVAVSGGDGIKGLFTRPSSALAAAIRFTEDLSPRPVVFGLGLGAVETEISYDDVESANGPCFHRAARAISHAKRGHWIVVDGLGQSEDAVANAQLALIGDLRASWTPRQLEIVKAQRGAATQQLSAVALGVSPSVVSESLQAARAKRIQACEAALAAWMDDACEAAP